MQEDIHDARMRLFHFIEQQRSRFGAFIGRAQKSLFARSAIRATGRAIPASGILTCIIADQVFQIAEKVCRKNLREFRFADARGAEK